MPWGITTKVINTICAQSIYLCINVSLFHLFAGQCAAGLQLNIEPVDIVVEQGAPANLDCQAKSNIAEPKITWRKDDGQIINFPTDEYRYIMIIFFSNMLTKILLETYFLPRYYFWRNTLIIK